MPVPFLLFLFLLPFLYHGPPLSGVTSHRQPRQCRGAQGPKTVKGARSDPNYVSTLLARIECLRGGGKNYSYATAAAR